MHAAREDTRWDKQVSKGEIPANRHAQEEAFWNWLTDTRRPNKKLAAANAKRR